ncbi:MAG: thioredoxin domain-containing protein, partial [Betaproteobacteria bacterium]
SGAQEAREMALRSLRAMALGGVRDHVGGGFHRYSVDAAWRVPHFEKMLYDQAQLVLALLEAAQVSGDPFYAEVAEDTLQYVAREMTDEAGGFYSAEDADSVPPEQAGAPHPHKAEGAFYLWRAADIDAVCGGDADVVKLRFGIEPDGNAPIDPQQEFVGRNLLYVARPVEEVAARTGRTPEAVTEALNRGRLAMFAARVRRPRPHLDDKVLTAWNGLMIAAFARASRVLDAPDGRGAAHLDAARRSAAFLRDRMWHPATRTLLRRYRTGHAEIEAFAEDYAYLVFGLLELFQADGDPAWLEWAIALQRRQDELFWDEAQGGWFSTTGRDPSVLLRMKEEYDGAEPTASSMSALNLLVLTHLAPDPGWSDRLERTLRLFGGRLDSMGRAVPMMAAALSTRIAGVQQIVLALADAADPGGRELARAVARRHLPFAIAFTVSNATRDRLARILPFVADMRPLDGRAAAYVCRDFSCQRPVTSAEELDRVAGASLLARP